MPYKIIITDSYFKKLTKFIKQNPEILPRYEKTMLLLEVNPKHPSLRLHKLKGSLREYYSISLNMKYRIVLDFIIKDNIIIPITIGAHNEAYK
jgi:addiction module RelE/StbE family toxin